MPLAEGSGIYTPPKKKKGGQTATQEHIQLVQHQGSGTNVPPSAGKPPGSGGSATSTRTWVITHQRFLRALGYSVRVDGVWGPGSQRAWQQYLSRRGGTTGQAVSSFDRDRRELAVFNRRLAVSQARQAAQLRTTLSKIQAAQRTLGGLFGADGDAPKPHLGQLGIVENQIARERQAQERAAFYGTERGQAAMTVMYLSQRMANPSSRNKVIAGMSAASLRTFLFDPEFGAYKGPTGAGVRVAQVYLRAHGHKVNVTGRLDPDTMDALVSTMRQLEMQEYREEVADIRDLFFGGPGEFRLGGPVNLEGLPGFHGRIPTAKQVVDRLRVNDVVARRLLRELYRRVSVRAMAQRQVKLGHIRTLQAAEARASYERIAAAARESEDSGILGTISRPFNWLSDKTRAGAVEIAWAADDLLHGRIDFYLDDEELARQEREAYATVGLFDTRHPWLGLATSLIADPTILIPGRVFLAPFVLGARGATRSALFLERAGYKLSASGRIVVLPSILKAPAEAGRLPGRASAAFKADLEAHGAGVGVDIARRVRTEIQHATRLIGDTRQAAHLAANSALRAGFKLPVLGNAAAAAGASLKAPPLIADRFDRAVMDAVKVVDEPGPDVVNEFVRLRFSVYSHATDGQLSDAGAVLQGNLMAAAYKTVVEDLARERAQAAVTALRSRSEHALVQTEYDRVFEETIEQAGPYSMGSSDLDDIIQSRMAAHISAINNLYLPALQRRIEMALDEVGETLFDPDTGRFVGGDNLDMLRKLGAEGFADDALVEVPNPLHGRFFSHNEALKYQASELRIRTAQKDSWFRRRVAAGEHPPKDWVAQQVKGIRAELNAVWVEVKAGPQKGLWTDTRETLDVAPHYARQYRTIRELRPEHLVVKGGQDPAEVFRLSDLARDPRRRALAGETEFGYFPLQQSIDRIASYFRFARPEGDEPVPLMRGFEHLVEDRADAQLLPEEAEALRMQEFQTTFSEFESARREAYDAVFAQALAHEGALYSALRYSRHRVGRGLWYSAEGWLGLWRFMVLPLRFGWTAVNYIDNTVKALVQGVTNPKYWFSALQGGRLDRGLLDATDGARTVFEAGWSEIRQVSRFFDDIFGTNMTETIDGAFDYFWQLPYDLHARVFSLHGFEFPEEFLKMTTYGQEGGRVLKGADDLEAMIARGETPTALDRAQARLKSFNDRVWDMMGNRAENFAKRAIYLKTYDKAIKDGHGLLDAHTLAWAKVDETLFDYSKISTFEDNVRFIVPFVQWARKNNQFWLKQAARRPGLSLGVMDSYGDFRAQVNEDLPEWMQRYMPLRVVSDVVARVPGLSWMVGPLADSVTDPVNLLSVKNLYRFFKDENPNLPDDRAGVPFLDGMVEALEDFGFSMNPLVRKPLELGQVLSLRTWQSIFPQTSLIEAFTRKFFHDRFPNGLNLEIMLEDQVLQLMGQEETADLAADNLDVYIRMEMAAQAHRGEQVSRETAERKIADWMFVQQVVGYFTGIYLRRMTPEDIYYSQISDALYRQALDWDDLSDEARTNYRVWKFAKLTSAERVELAEDLGVAPGTMPDNAMFDRYVEMLPLVHAFYRMPSYVEARKFLHEHVELMPFVDQGIATYHGEPGYVAKARLNEQTDLAFSLFDLVDKLDLSPETAQAAESLLVTPELRAYWASNDTPADRRQKMLRGQYHHHITQLNRAYHSIPEDDFEARKGFLRENPNLLRSWWNDNSNSDDFKVIIQGVQADLRDRYFEYVEDGDWDGAGAFLSQFPFLFDHFDKDGDFVKDFTTGRTQTQHAADFAKASRWLQLYWSMAPDQRARWLESGAEGAALVRHYFDMYGSSRTGSQGGSSQHARDYLAAKPWLDYYFSLSKSQRSAWLNSGAKGSDVVLAYFKRYGTTNRIGRSFSSANFGSLGSSRNAELNRRLAFWQRYFALPADQRPSFVLRHAEDYGIFVYGVLGSKERHDQEMAWYRRAMLGGLSDRAAHFLYVKPLLDFYFSLKNKDARRLFLRANPEVQAYFDGYSRKSMTGDPRLDNLVERYFRLPEDSNERSFFLQQHPEVQDFFDERSTPAERAMRNLLDVYFDIDGKQQREKFLAKHPEITAYFERRQAERDAERVQLEAFDQADPRYRPFRLAGEEVTSASAEWMQRILAGTALTGSLDIRRTRR